MTLGSNDERPDNLAMAALRCTKPSTTSSAWSRQLSHCSASVFTNATCAPTNEEEVRHLEGSSGTGPRKMRTIYPWPSSYFLAWIRADQSYITVGGSDSPCAAAWIACTPSLT